MVRMLLTLQLPAVALLCVPLYLYNLLNCSIAATFATSLIQYRGLLGNTKITFYAEKK